MNQAAIHGHMIRKRACKLPFKFCPRYSRRRSFGDVAPWKVLRNKTISEASTISAPFENSTGKEKLLWGYPPNGGALRKCVSIEFPACLEDDGKFLTRNEQLALQPKPLKAVNAEEGQKQDEAKEPEVAPSQKPKGRKPAGSDVDIRPSKKFRPAPPKASEKAEPAEPEPDAAPAGTEPKAKSAAKAKAKSAPKAKGKAKSSPKATAKSKAKAANSSSKNEGNNDEPAKKKQRTDPVPPFTPKELQSDIMQELIENDLVVGGKGLDFQQFKEHLAPAKWERTFTNMYWTRAQVGLRSRDNNEQLCTFGFGMSYWYISMCCATSCANLLVPLIGHALLSHVDVYFPSRTNPSVNIL